MRWRGALVTVSVTLAIVACHREPIDPTAELPRSRSSSGKPLVQPGKEITLRLLAGADGRWASPATVGAVRDVLRAWSRERLGCTSLHFRLEIAKGPQRDCQHNGVNEIAFLDAEWCPSSARSPADCFDAHELAVSRTYVATTAGAEDHIVETDIRFNAVGFAWEGEERAAVLRRTLSHELGHLLGLDDPPSCPPSPTSSNGARARAGIESVMCPIDDAHPPANFPWEPTAYDRRFACAVYPR